MERNEQVERTEDMAAHSEELVKTECVEATESNKQPTEMELAAQEKD